LSFPDRPGTNVTGVTGKGVSRSFAGGERTFTMSCFAASGRLLLEVVEVHPSETKNTIAAARNRLRIMIRDPLYP
jgi:hypothetical protein